MVAKRLLIIPMLIICAGFAFCYFSPFANTNRNSDTLTASPIDIGFAQYMSVHHDQAVLLSQLLLDDRVVTDKRPSKLRNFALSISTAQLIEIGTMRGWLQLWGVETYPATMDMNWMLLAPKLPSEELQQYLLDCRDSELGMPGLVKNSELEELRKMDRDARDARFLELMLRHHEGGIPMAKFAAEFARLPVVRNLAQRMIIEQTKELMMMRRALNAITK
ncbi:DUF305 domain-containing protein [Zhongshania sp.]|uniref:DUF305 domain-containing protein n=3 Tax=Zhongshania sp. TaxID=1971902 RepID=UPI0035661221